MTDQESAAALSAATQEIEWLKSRVERLERFSQPLPRTWLLSASFLKRAFGATEIQRIPNNSGGTMHAEVRIDDSVIMLAPLA